MSTSSRARSNIDPRQIPEALTPRTKAIVPVHLFGHAADLDPILDIAQRHGLAVLEDVAQAFGGHYRGRPLGSLGHAAAFSFYPTKNLGAFGDAGLLATNDDHVAELARKLRTHGSLSRDRNEMIGYNSRLDEIQAAILRVKLRYVEDWNHERQRAAATYRRLLADVAGIVPPVVEDYADHVFNQFTVRISDCDRDAVQKSLAAAGIGTNVYYSGAGASPAGLCRPSLRPARGGVGGSPSSEPADGAAAFQRVDRTRGGRAPQCLCVRVRGDSCSVATSGLKRPIGRNLRAIPMATRLTPAKRKAQALALLESPQISALFEKVRLASDPPREPSPRKKSPLPAAIGIGILCTLAWWCFGGLRSGALRATLPGGSHAANSAVGDTCLYRGDFYPNSGIQTLRQLQILKTGVERCRRIRGWPHAELPSRYSPIGSRSHLTLTTRRSH